MIYETVIGLEVHVQLATASKAFCGDDATFGAAPNTHISAISLAHPGTLPRVNERQIALAVRLGLALGCQISERNMFDRKNYFYADLPKGYQITQDRSPICIGGGLQIRTISGQTRHIRLHHIHIEEDAGKSIHDQRPNVSLIDLNRAGVPLLEIVTEPDLRNADEVDAFMTAMRRLVRWLGVSDGNMEEGSMRCDCNVSIRPMGSAKLGQRCEIKNMNSMRFARRAVNYEVQRQTNLVESGGTVEQQTLAFDPVSGTTSPLRDKENAHDYRYFPDPDLPPIVITPEAIEAVRAAMPALPEACYLRFVEAFGLAPDDAAILSDEYQTAQSFLKFVAQTPHYKLAANLLINKLLPHCRQTETDPTTLPFGALSEYIELIEQGKVSHSTAGQQLLPALLAEPQASVLHLAEKLNLIQTSDTDQLGPIATDIVAQNPDKAAAYRKGKKGLMGFFMGEFMRTTGGKADPKTATKLLEEALKG